MQGNRAERLAESIRQEVIEIVEYELLDERIGSVAVNAVKVTPDLRNAAIFVDIVGDKQQIKQSLTGLRNAVGFVRSQLALRLQLRRTPDIIFQYDDTEKKAARIEQLLGEERENKPED